ncbi:thermonuclease family protein [Neoroseomonas oryzicola]
MWRRRRQLPPELRDALRDAERRTRRDRNRTLIWRLRPLGRVLAPVAAGLALLGGFVAWQARMVATNPGQAQSSASVAARPPAAPPSTPTTVAPPPAAPPGGLPRVVYGPVPEAPEPAAPAVQPAATRFSVRPAVIDGDTLAAGTDRLRIHGIDAPEMDQTCQRRGGTYPCGSAARDAMVAIVGRGGLTCEALDTDRYGRSVVRCVTDRGTDIGAELVRQGWAVAFRRFSLDYVAQEADARAARRGIWEGSFMDPSDWRARSR